MTSHARLSRALWVLLVAVLVLLSFGTDRVLAERRVALVIGNAAYKHVAHLANPTNDASDIAASLERLGFEVILGTDLDRSQFSDLVYTFTNRLRGADVGLFYYAGHGLQMRGENYLTAVDTQLRHVGDLDFQTVELELIMRQMKQGAKANIVLLDACRNNPFVAELQASDRASVPRGLARMEQVSGTYVAFATSPGTVALDGDGRNSPFTTALLENIERPGVELSTLMTDVRQAVHQETLGKQVPWSNNSLLRQFYFKEKVEVAVAALPEKPAVEQPVVQSDTTNEPRLSPVAKADDERSAWIGIQFSKDPLDILDFISKYPTGPFAEVARLRLESLLRRPGKPDNSDKVDKEQVQAASDAERAAWVEVQFSQDPLEILDFMSSYPGGAFDSVARLRLDTLMRMQREKRRTEQAALQNQPTRSDPVAPITKPASAAPAPQPVVTQPTAAATPVQPAITQPTPIPTLTEPAPAPAQPSSVVVQETPAAPASSTAAPQAQPTTAAPPSQGTMQVAAANPATPIEPEPPRLVGRALVLRIQQELQRVGCNPGRPDGDWGPKSTRAANSFMRHSRVRIASARPTDELLDALESENRRVCPLVCGAKYRVKSGRCVLKTCRSDQILTSKGTCIAKKKPKPKPSVAKANPTAPKKKTKKKSSGCPSTQYFIRGYGCVSKRGFRPDNAIIDGIVVRRPRCTRFNPATQLFVPTGNCY